MLGLVGLQAILGSAVNQGTVDTRGSVVRGAADTPVLADALDTVGFRDGAVRESADTQDSVGDRGTRDFVDSAVILDTQVLIQEPVDLVEQVAHQGLADSLDLEFQGTQDTQGIQQLPQVLQGIQVFVGYRDIQDIVAPAGTQDFLGLAVILDSADYLVTLGTVGSLGHLDTVDIQDHLGIQDILDFPLQVPEQADIRGFVGCQGTQGSAG